jgi:hypothetical protein
MKVLFSLNRFVLSSPVLSSESVAVYHFPKQHDLLQKEQVFLAACSVFLCPDLRFLVSIVEASCFFRKFRKKNMWLCMKLFYEFNNFKSCYFSEPADSVMCLQPKPICMVLLTRGFFGWIHIISKQVTCCVNFLLQMKGATTNVASILSMVC